MPFLWILAAIFFLVVFLLTVHVRIVVSYDGDVALSLRVMGIRIPLLPKPKKKIKPSDFSLKRYNRLLKKDAERAAKKQQKKLEKSRKKAEKKAEKKKAKKLPSSGVTVKDESGTLSILLSVIGGVLDRCLGKLRVDLLRLRITVGGSDAAQTAVTYGIVAQGVAYLCELIAQKTKFRRRKKEEISVTPDFLAQTTTADILVIFAVNLWYFIDILLTLAFRFIVEKIRRESELT